MGMAASQARYLALVARKSNCEYEGQQINQSRLALSNQSADLFSQMMGLEVPKTPSKSDFTYTTYTFSDGDNDYVIKKWNQLADTTDGYNYTVTYDYKTTENTGFQKYKRDPQVQFSGVVPTPSTIPEQQVNELLTALNQMEADKAAAKKAEADYGNLLALAKNISNYQDTQSIIAATGQYDSETKQYTITSGSDNYVYTQLDSAPDVNIDKIKEDLLTLVDYGALTLSDLGVDEEGKCNFSNVFYNPDTDSVAFSKDLYAIVQSELGATLPIYHFEDETKIPSGAKCVTMEKMINDVKTAYTAAILANRTYEASKAAYEKLSSPSYIGNTSLVAIGNADLTKDMVAQISKIINQMKEDGIECNLVKCFNTLDGTYDETTYIGGLYTFDWTTNTYFATYYDLYNSVINGTGVNNIDDQVKLPYYGTQDIDKEIELVSRALLEKEKSGRFTSIRLEDDSVVYDLTAVTETDEVAYADAMNEANYQKALYDHKVQEINAKTSIIQRQDQQLELRLKQLDTEQNALNTEIEAVSKVVKDNIEKSFKTFNS